MLLSAALQPWRSLFLSTHAHRAPAAPGAVIAIGLLRAPVGMEHAESGHWLEDIIPEHAKDPTLMAVAQTSSISGLLPGLSRNSDISLAVAVVGILVFMVIPLPPMLLDLLLAFSITFSLIILLVAMYVQRPLELSAFPSILLLTTLFRLSLNIATTRVVLLHGHEGTGAAGNIIKAFGGFVVGGNYVVGLIVFVILVVINFAVITKGAGRIAEVAARFTLDAMPGKQMSIDADLNAGFINEQEARSRRELLSREAEYYGAMDGANKFVRGDAVAGIIITVVNILGGLSIGVF